MTSLSAATRLEDWRFPTLPEQSVAEHWYAAYTCSNQEKRVAAQLNARNVEYFLPLYSSLRRWKDRRVKLDLPLFPGYVFVRLALKDRLRVLQIPGLVRLVGFGGIPAALSEEDMEVLRPALSERLHAEPHSFLTAGRRVKIVRGSLAGLQGVLQRCKGNLRLVVSVELIQRSIAVDVNVSDVQLSPQGARNSVCVKPEIFKR